jgi:hypothetical protein
MTLSSGEKIALAVGGGVAVGGVIYAVTRPKAAAATTAPALPVTPAAPATSAWTEITGQTVTIPTGTTIALSYVNPPPAAVAELEAIGQAAASEAAEVGIYPVGTPAPADFPADGAGLTAYRATVKVSVPAGNPVAPGLRVWTHP